MKKLTCTLLAISSIALSACEKTAEGQVVAVVNGEEITEQQLNAEIDAANIPDNVDKKAATQQLLKGLIDRTLLVQKAKAEGIDTSPEYINQSRRAEAQILIGLLADKTGKSIQLPDKAAVSKFISDNPSLFAGRKIYGLNQIVFPVSGNDIIEKLKPAHSLDEVAAVLTANNIKFTRQSGALDTLGLAPEMAKRIADLPAGEPFIAPDKGQLVASVVMAVKDAPVPDDNAFKIAQNMLRQKKLREAMETVQKEEATKAEITYRPDMTPTEIKK